MSRRYLEFLAGVPLFSACSKRELAHLAARTTGLPVEAGTVLMEEDTPGYEFFVIVSGYAQVSRHGHVVTELGPGEFFGELALLDRAPRNATVTAATRMEVIVLNRAEFLESVAQAPRMTMKLLAGMSRRLRHLDRVS